MATWLIAFRSRFEEAVHALLWRQWTLLGVAGSGTPDPGRTVIDPEALLLLTLEAARTEPRLFDEVLDWLKVNGHWMDVQRLRNVSRADEGGPHRLLSAVAAFAAVTESTPKWRRLAAPSGKPVRKPEPLFLPPAAGASRALDALFARYGYRRRPVETRGLSNPVPVRSAPCLRFRLRALFGIGIRAEALTLLLARGPGHAKEVARSIGYSFPGALQALRELAISDAVHVRAKGREKRYWLDGGRWLGFLKIRPPLAWADWREYFHGLALILRFLRRPDFDSMTPYVQESELNQVFARAAAHLMAVEAPFRPPPPEGRPAEAYAAEVLASVESACSKNS